MCINGSALEVASRAPDEKVTYSLTSVISGGLLLEQNGFIGIS